MGESLEITFHGAARTVTGSCMQLRYGDLAVLIDCGLFQGSRTLETLNRDAFPFDASRLAAVILNHAHIEHSGLLPKLVAEGYGGTIWCTYATRHLLSPMTTTHGRTQESEPQ